MPRSGPRVRAVHASDVTSLHHVSRSHKGCSHAENAQVRAGRQAGGQAGGQAGRRAGRQAGGQAGGQAGRRLTIESCQDIRTWAVGQICADKANVRTRQMF